MGKTRSHDNEKERRKKPSVSKERRERILVDQKVFLRIYKEMFAFRYLQLVASRVVRSNVL